MKTKQQFREAHTPAPWKLHRHVNGGQCLVTDNEAMTHIMLISEARGMGHAAEANVRLIAAAPELLEALKNMLDDNAITQYCQFPQYKALFERARAAVVKAKGK